MQTEPLPWHSAVSPVYHTEPACIRGQKVSAEHRLDGKGGKFHCHWCKKLARRWQMREQREAN